jgi:tripeptide aminopeptidase
MKDQYRNMKEKLDEYPQAMALARKAMETAGLDVITKPIRGGTDGSALTLMGIPTPNVGAGGHNFHGPREFIPTANMETAVDVIIELVLAAANS